MSPIANQRLVGRLDDHRLTSWTTVRFSSQGSLSSASNELKSFDDLHLGSNGCQKFAVLLKVSTERTPGSAKGLHLTKRSDNQIDLYGMLDRPTYVLPLQRFSHSDPVADRQCDL